MVKSLSGIFFILFFEFTFAQVTKYDHLYDKFGHFKEVKATTADGAKLLLYEKLENRTKVYRYILAKDGKLFEMKLPEIQGNLQKAGKTIGFSKFALSYKNWLIIGVGIKDDEGGVEPAAIDQVFFYTNSQNSVLMMEGTDIDETGALVRTNLTPYWYALGDFLYYRSGNNIKKFDGERTVNWFEVPENQPHYQLFELNGKIFGIAQHKLFDQHEDLRQKTYLHNEDGTRRELEFLNKVSEEMKLMEIYFAHKGFQAELKGDLQNTPRSSGHAWFDRGKYWFIVARHQTIPSSIYGHKVHRQDILGWDPSTNKTELITYGNRDFIIRDGFQEFLGKVGNRWYVRTRGSDFRYSTHLKHIQDLVSYISPKGSVTTLKPAIDYDGFWSKPDYPILAEKNIPYFYGTRWQNGNIVSRAYCFPYEGAFYADSRFSGYFGTYKGNRYQWFKSGDKFYFNTSEKGDFGGTLSSIQFNEDVRLIER